jgi:two-component system sensor histidine kinase KdpD
MREVADASRSRAHALLSLNDFAAVLSGAHNPSAILQALASQVAHTVRGSAVVLTDDGDNLSISAAVPADTSLSSADLQAAGRARRSRAAVPAAAAGWPGPCYEFCPLATDRGVIAVVGFRPADGKRAIGFQDQATLQTILRHAAIAIERIRFEAEGAAARDEAEREHVRSALLSSLSHDLRTPLASILGAVTSLRQLGDSMPAETRADLLLAIEEETSRLSQFVVNLLDLTRLETEPPDLRRDWLDVADVTQAAVARARQLFAGRDIEFSVAQRVPLVRGDAMLFEHVVINLIDNAVKYSSAPGGISLAVTTDGGNVQLSVCDAGCGIAPEYLTAVFEKFYRIRPGDRDAPGTGLGLTICKRVVEQMGGTIRAESPVDGQPGTGIVITLPATAQTDETPP